MADRPRHNPDHDGPEADAVRGACGGPRADSAGKAPAAKAGARIGNYEIRSKLGSGAFGAVYRAYNAGLGREVALKIPHHSTLTDDRARERFLREARAAAQLDHANIVPVFDAGQARGRYYIAYGFIEGRTLAAVVGNDGLPFRQSAEVVAALADGLQHAHERKVVHRDVKPENVMMDREGRPHLMDFGLAHQQDAATRITLEGSVVGSPAYIAPEHAKGQNVEPQPSADQYSLGVLLYELLTGRRPFSGRTEVVLSLAVHRPPPAPRGINSRIPVDLETICLKALEREPEKRYPTCEELGADLRRWLAGEPISARPVGPADRAIRWCRRQPALALTGTGLVGALVLCGVLLWALGSARSSSDQRLGGPEEARPTTSTPQDRSPVSSDAGTSAGPTEAGPPISTQVEHQARRRQLEETDAFDAVAAREAAMSPAEGVAAWERFLEDYPNGMLTAEARNRLNQLRERLAAVRGPKLPEGLESAFEIPTVEKDQHGNPVREGADPKTGWALEIRHKDTAMDFVFIAPGEFMMGSKLSAKEIVKQFKLDEDDEKYFMDEHPRHRVKLTKPFYLAKYETTQAEWKKIMESEPWKGEAYAKEDPSHAANYVSWDDCQALVKKLNSAFRAPRSALQFALPTEAQWEYACRAGAETMYSFGEDASKLGDYAWFDGNAYDKGDKYAHPAGRKKPNEWGLYDMHGNVWEWCQDWYGTYLEGDQTDPAGAKDGSGRVGRGGGWDCTAGYCRSAYRGSDSPGRRWRRRGCRLSLRSFP